MAGSSDWFERGFVTYSNAAKQELLGVRAETLCAHGAVSEDTAREMARGRARAQRSGTVALAVTGVAGPGGGTPGEAGRHGVLRMGAGRERSTAKPGASQGDRESVRRQSVVLALEGVLKALDGG